MNTTANENQTNDEDELYEHFRLEVDKGQSLMRIDKYLTHHSRISRTKIQHSIDAQALQVNGKPAKASYRVKPFDVITLSLPYEKRDFELIPENIPLDIIYEDDDLMIVNKAAGMVVHPAVGHWTGTLVNGLVYYLQNLPTHRNGEIRPGLVHRIDKDTTGLLVIAKNEFAMTFLAKQFFDHTIERTYIALVWGELKDKGTIIGNIARNANNRKLFEVTQGEQGKHAVSHYEVLQNFRYVSLVKCNLETGRTHQIRVHFKHIGHTLFGDGDYGGNKILKGNVSGKYKVFAEKNLELMPRQALHAKSLGFVHPTTRQWVQFDSELPSDFQAVLFNWENFGDK